MWPRMGVFIFPRDRDRGVYGVRVLKGWWNGPGHGGAHATLYEGEMVLDTHKVTSERELLRQALRQLADELPG